MKGLFVVVFKKLIYLYMGRKGIFFQIFDNVIVVVLFWDGGRRGGKEQS